MSVFTEGTKLVEATHFLYHFFYLCLVDLIEISLIFKTHFGRSWVKAMEAFTGVTKLVESFELE